MPSLTLTAEDAAARVRIDVSDGPALVERLDGDTWTTVRHGWAATGTLYDYEAPSRGEVSYRADGGTPVVVEVEVAGFWLIDPVVPSLGGRVPVELAAITVTRERRQQAFAPLGRDRDVVVSGLRRGRTWELDALLIGHEPWDLLEAVTESGRVLVWRTDTGDLAYVAQLGELAATVEPTVTRADRPVRRVPLRLLEVERPTDFTEPAGGS
jgi:hypothetical protein